MFDINARLTSNYILLFWFYVRSVTLIYGTGTIGWENSALDRTSILFIKFKFYCGRLAALQNWVIWYELIWLCFILTYWCCLMNWGLHINGGHWNLEVSVRNIVALIFLIFSFKCSWYIIGILKSSCPEVFCKKGVLKHFAKFIGKQLYRSLFFYKIAGRLQKRPWHMWFSIKLQESYF